MGILFPGRPAFRSLAGVPVRLGPSSGFPDPERIADENGLVAVGGDLSVPRLLQAYRQGIFPWTVSPITWWSPDPRGVIELEELHISRSLARTLRRKVFEVSINRDFRGVMLGCAGQKRGERTWITPEFVAAYCQLHAAGHAHSVECWNGDRLVGGIYGVAVGAAFAGESMFHAEDDASKVALVHLVGRLREKGFQLFDIQMVTPATEQLGAREIPRAEYLRRLRAAVTIETSFR